MLTACSARAPVDDLPEVKETLAAVGRRLARSMSAGDLTALGGRGDRVLAVLSRDERDALGRGHLRFRVDRPVVVEVFAPEGSVLFWLEDQGFATSGERLRNADGAFIVYRKAFDAGPIGLCVNGLDRSAPAHYAVFVRPREAGTAPILSDVRPAPCRAVAADDGVSPYVDVHRPFDRFPPSLRGATLLQTCHDPRHAGVLLKGRAWKTHVPSGRTPDQVAISFGADAARSLTWTWRTGPQVRATALRVGPAAPGRAVPADPTAVRVVRGDSRAVECDDLLNDPSIRRHRVALEGLDPDTTYAYALGDGTDEGWGPWRAVRTGPVPGGDTRFLYVGDPQCGLEGWGRLMRAAHRRRPDAGLLLIAGDLVDRGNERSNWDHFFLRAARVFDVLPMMPCVGNHEYLAQDPGSTETSSRRPAMAPPASTRTWSTRSSMARR